MSNIVISIEDLSKTYRIGEIGTGTFYGDLKRWWASQRGKPDPYLKIGETGHGKREGEIIWALKDVNFTVQQGEAVGIIGSNGAGKSTLLKILSRVTVPTSGVVKVKGRIASLLEVGTGFHPELTGRENILLNGTIMGMTRSEVNRKFDEIVDFSGVEQFIDTPVKRYSSGMYVRLAFAVAAHLEPEILIVDEVLAVGDAQFQRKCLGKMDDAAKGGRTVLFVSHNMSSISHLCDTVIWVDKGQVTMRAPTEEVISAYLNREAPSVVGHKEWFGGLSQPGVDELVLNEVSIIDSNNQVTSSVSAQKPFSICIKYTIKKQLPYCRVGFDLLTDNGDVIFESFDSDDVRYTGSRQAGEYSSYCVIPGNFLNTKKYFVSIYAGMPGIKYLAGAENVLTFEVENVGAIGSHLPDFGRRGIVRPLLEWHQKKNTKGENAGS
jgi:lipopolysaccharide transport system ATP-binding protein